MRQLVLHYNAQSNNNIDENDVECEDDDVDDVENDNLGIWSNWTQCRPIDHRKHYNETMGHDREGEIHAYIHTHTHTKVQTLDQLI